MSKSILGKTQTGEIQLTISIPKEEIQKSFEKAMLAIVEETELPGFRKGKAPRKLVEEKTDKAKIYERVLQDVVPQAYVEAVKEHHLRPIVSPKVELLKAKEEEDWEVRATTCEEPILTLGNYKEEIRKNLAASKLWKPGDELPNAKDVDPQKAENLEDEKTQKVIQTLLDTIKPEIPAMLLEEEVNRSLANLLNQTNTLGLTIEQYLASIGKSADQVRSEYHERAKTSFQLQFILDKIAESEKIEVAEKEIDDLIAATGDDKLKTSLNDPLQRNYLQGVIKRRKVLEFLAKL